ncbi:MAG TPA: dTDP-4-dehydrorhamnose 3,5-epimerase [Bacteroidales bacterium]|nr:dTDP-4-dehydrorhamnose 3,5-epimerase [Bacteroidales bacterium]HPI87380.1 dTDP-4-dehydrorhamnose 3,5-epimerase [Bacteroidales bacterium]HPM92907.1 dTDP-4-dehydrorhamnose 3,5-epimerase [Bacteroidales bacterium]
MKIHKTEIEDLLVIHPDVFPDERGYFFESYQKEKFREAGLNWDFVQDNESMSMKGVLRGLHFQLPPFAQGKLVRVVRGAVLDVAVDLRKNSATYGQWASFRISAENKWMAFIPAGFAHGFLVLEDHTIFQYKCTNYYNKESESGIIWNDPELAIDWGIEHPLVSEKDLQGLRFKDFVSPF